MYNSNMFFVYLARPGLVRRVAPVYLGVTEKKGFPPLPWHAYFVRYLLWLNAFTAGNPFWEKNCLKLVQAGILGLYISTPSLLETFFGTTLLEFSISRDFGVLQGSTAHT